MRRGRLYLAVVALLGAAACGHEDDFVHCGNCVSYFTTSCRAVDSDLLCTLVDQVRTDLTADGAWSVTGPAEAGAAGHIRTTGYGEIVVTVGYPLFHQGTREVGRWLADPPRRPRRLYWISGDALDAGSGAPLGGVRFSVVDGYNAGRGAVSDARGRFRVEPLLTEEDFTYRAEKAGYEPLTARFRLGDPNGSDDPLASGPFLVLRLVRLP